MGAGLADGIEQRARRRLMWISVAVSLMMSLLVGAFIAYWYAAWPFPAHVVVLTSPWMEPRFRAHAKAIMNDQPGDSTVQMTLGNFIDKDLRARGSAVYSEYLACLRSEDVSVRWVALMFIESVNSTKSLPESIQVEVIQLIDDRHPAISEMAMRAITFFPPAAAKPVLRRSLSFVEHRIRAIEGPAIPGDQEAAAWLIPLLEDADPMIRGMAVRSLTTIAVPATIPAVQRLSKDGDPFVARGVAQFFKKMGTSPGTTEHR